MKKEYLLMNKDEKLFSFCIDKSPLGEKIYITREFSDLKPIGFDDINTWLNRRNYAKHKTHFIKWLKEWNLDTTEGFIDVTHCLGINDTLWVKENGSSLLWQDVNLYDNQFIDVAQTTCFETGLNGLQLSSIDLSNIKSPEFTAEGSVPKCWKKEKEGIYLYKSQLSGSANSGLEANAEYISANIARQIVGNKSIPYALGMFKDKLCSKCKLFTSEKYGYVPFYKFFKNKVYTIGEVINKCEELGYKEDAMKMFLVDSIIFNQDRHQGNFGFIVDNETFEIKEFAPLFDYNLSMLYAAMPEDIESLKAFHRYEDEYMVGHKLGGEFSEIGKALISENNALKEIIPKDIKFPIHEKYNLDKTRTSKIIDIFEENLQIMTDKHFYKVEPALQVSRKNKISKMEEV